MMQWILIAELVIRLLELQQEQNKGEKLSLDVIPKVAEAVGIKGKYAEELPLALPRIEMLAIRLNRLFKKDKK